MTRIRLTGLPCSCEASHDDFGRLVSKPSLRGLSLGHVAIQCIISSFLLCSLSSTAYAESSRSPLPKTEKSNTETSKQIEAPKKEIATNEKAKEEPIKFDPLNESSEEEIVLFQELAKRSQEISAREENLKQQSLILKAAKASMGEKLKHFDLLKQDLLKTLNKLKENEEKQVEDLVKIYAAMKPKQAASILNQMDMTILKEIVKRMAKKKAALIMAAMDTKKAKDLSQTLAKESQNIS